MLFAFASGALAHCLPAVLPVTKITTDGLLFVLNGLVLYAIYRRNGDRRLFWWLAVAYWFTFAMEAVGVATGAVFGQYAYGPTMWFQWLGVPFVIALNWCVLTLACNELAVALLGRLTNAFSPDEVGEKVRPTTSGPKPEPSDASTISRPASKPSDNSPMILRTTPKPSDEPSAAGYAAVREFVRRPSAILTAALAAIMTALYDVAIEPVAIALDYWQWGGGEIPLQNYLAWAIIAFVISLPLHLFRIRFRSPVLLVYFFAQLFFFGVLNLAL